MFWFFLFFLINFCVLLKFFGKNKFLSVFLAKHFGQHFLEINLSANSPQLVSLVISLDFFARLHCLTYISETSPSGR